MDPVTLGGIFTIGSKLIDRFFPDKVAADAAKLQLLEMNQKGELAVLAAETGLATKQAEINIEEAKHENVFVSGWRPFIGWVCGFSFGAKYLGGPLVFVIAQFTDHPIVLPDIDMFEMMPLLFGMLGLGAYRSYDKKQRLVNA
jgi:hypothetical protein